VSACLFSFLLPHQELLLLCFTFGNQQSFVANQSPRMGLDEEAANIQEECTT